MKIAAGLLMLAFLIKAVLGWDYSQQYNWPTTCTKGTTQSPIRIPDVDSLPESEIRYILGYSWYNPSIPSRMMDNGHSLVVCFFVLVFALAGEQEKDLRETKTTIISFSAT